MTYCNDFWLKSPIIWLVNLTKSEQIEINAIKINFYGIFDIIRHHIMELMCYN